MTAPAPDTASSLRIVFFGTPQFSVPSLTGLIESSNPVVAVVTQPDRPRGRGQHVLMSPVKDVAMRHGVPVMQPDRLKDPAFVESFRALAADLAVVAAYGRILPDWLLGAPRLGTINVHASLLPSYRGAAPIHRAVIAGETQTGVTIMRVVRELDAGPTLTREKRAIGPDETSDEVERALAHLGADLLLRTIPLLVSGNLEEVPQDHALATYAPRIVREDGVIRWEADASVIHNQVRGVHPWPLAFTYLGGTRYVVRRSRPEADRRTDSAPGTILAARGDELAVAAGNGVLHVLELQLEGRRPMTTRAFLAGHPLAVGSQFTSAGVRQS